MQPQLKPNLDLICFENGTQIPLGKGNKSEIDKVEDMKKNEIVIRKSLGVLQEDGVFAFILYLGAEGAFKTVKSNEKDNKMKDEEKIVRNVREKVCELLKRQEIGLLDDIDPDNQQGVINDFKTLGEDLNDLLLAKTLIEKTLIYALYHAKSMR